MYHKGLGFTEDADGLLWDEEGNRVYYYGRLWKKFGTKTQGTTQYYVPDSDIPQRFVRDIYDKTGNYDYSLYYMAIPEGVDMPDPIIYDGKTFEPKIIKEPFGEITDPDYLRPADVIMKFDRPGSWANFGDGTGISLEVQTEPTVPWFDPTFPEHPEGTPEGTCSPLHADPEAPNPFLAKASWEKPLKFVGAGTGDPGSASQGLGWTSTAGTPVASVSQWEDKPPFDLRNLLYKTKPSIKGDEYTVGGVAYKLGTKKKVGEKTYILTPPLKYTNLTDLQRYGFSPKYATELMSGIPSEATMPPSKMAMSTPSMPTTPSMVDVQGKKQSFLKNMLGKFF